MNEWNWTAGFTERVEQEEVEDDSMKPAQPMELNVGIYFRIASFTDLKCII